MKKNPFTLIALYCFFILADSAYAVGEKVLLIGPDSWELMEKKQGVIVASRLRPGPVLVLENSHNASMNDDRSWPGIPAALTSAREGFPSSSSALDLRLSFDEGQPQAFADSRGRYDVLTSPELASADAPWSRSGSGAALFPGSQAATRAQGSPLVLRPGKDALFAPGGRIRDFSIEFWLYPYGLENGEQVLFLSSSKADGRGAYLDQRIQCYVSKNKIQWVFGDFFFSPDEKGRKALALSGPSLLPRKWAHHLVRFDADIGLLEYLVDGRLEAVEYATSTGREGGEVYTPAIGQDCRLELGNRFCGMMDEFRIYRSYLESPALAKYPERGGRAETRALDLGNANSRALKIEAFGGRTGNPLPTTGLVSVRNEYAGNGALGFPDHAEMQFFIRAGNAPYLWDGLPWIPFNPGTDLPDSLRSRFVQIAVDFYPSENGETSPYLSELRIIYDAGEPPPPPTQVTAAAKNGAVELSWRTSPSKDVGGYMVYYGTARGEYFGDHTVLGSAVQVSPLDVGNRTSVRIEGLNNGTIYYFAVAAYYKPAALAAGITPEPGEFSREVSARPLRMIE
jgi:hypothetical protein